MDENISPLAGVNNSKNVHASFSDLHDLGKENSLLLKQTRKHTLHLLYTNITKWKFLHSTMQTAHKLTDTFYSVTHRIHWDELQLIWPTTSSICPFKRQKCQSALTENEEVWAECVLHWVSASRSHANLNKHCISVTSVYFKFLLRNGSCIKFTKQHT